ncbi:hypothetical protein [Halorubrum aethiopicum]|uniref:hypothetical protein n=1 Tax=Halorubrum aethiopicum TaxID=1758255 RepID=UPI00082CC400|nr:hypothetical protein [Halorubrum aethiopicum]
MTRGAAVAAASLAVLCVLSALGAAMPAMAAAAPAPQVENSSVDFEPPGPFEISELRTGGNQPAAAPPAVRYVGGSPPSGAMAIRYTPAGPLENEPVHLERGTTLNTDQIELYSTVFGSQSTGEYEAVIVYWQPASQTVNGTTVEYAADQEVQRVTVDVESGYATAPIALNSHYNESVEATMWLERDGELVDGARWRFGHASAPASQQVAIDTQADAWWYVFRTAILPGIGAIVIGLSGARATLKRTGRGPGYSLGTWGFVSGVGILLALAGLYYELAVVVEHLDILMGMSLLPIAYGGGLRMSPPLERIAFERKELTEAVSLRRGESEEKADPDAVPDGGSGPASSVTDRVGLDDDGYFDELYEDLKLLPTVRAPTGGRLLPKKGIRPFFARLFSSAAKLDLSDLRTRVRVSGSASQKVYVDPEGETAVDHRPAHLRRRMPVWHRLPKPADGEKLSPITRGLYALLTIGVLALPLIGWHVGGTVANVPFVGAFIGVVLLAIESYEAVDGSISFEPAPRHDITADASLTVLQSEHADAKTIDELEEVAWNERSRTALEAREIESRRNKTLVQQLSEGEVGMDLDVLGMDANAGSGLDTDGALADSDEDTRKAEGDDDD